MPDVLTEVRKRRGPFTRIVIGLVVAWLVLGAVRTVLSVFAGQHVLVAAGRHAGDFVSVPVLVVLLLFVVAVVWVRPRLDNAAALARSATWAASVAVSVSIVAGVLGLAAPDLRGSERLLSGAGIVVSSVVPVLLCVALGTIAGAARRADAQAGPEPVAAVEGEAAGPAGAPPVTPGEVGPGAADEVAPTWSPDEAAGAAWTSAADAARGTASSWGDDRDAHGWQVQPPAAGSIGPGDAASGPGREDSSDREANAPGRLDRGLWQVPPRDTD